MLDDFRNQAESSDFFDEDPEDEFVFEEVAPARSQSTFLGLSPAQRFVLALILLALTCLLSSLCLLVTERIALPFL